MTVDVCSSCDELLRTVNMYRLPVFQALTSPPLYRIIICTPIQKENTRTGRDPNTFLQRMALGMTSKWHDVLLLWLLATLLDATWQVTAEELVEAGDVVRVSVSANAFDPDTDGDENGCPPYGCKPENTRDGDLEENSRWSCKRELVEEVGGAVGEECRIVYNFSDALDVYGISVALYQGDTGPARDRTMNVEVNGEQFVFIESDGSTIEEDFELNAQGVRSLGLVSVGLEADAWLSIIEVRV